MARGPEYCFLKALFNHVPKGWLNAESEGFKSQLTFPLLDENAIKPQISSQTCNKSSPKKWERGLGRPCLEHTGFVWDDEEKCWR